MTPALATRRSSQRANQQVEIDLTVEDVDALHR
jgi:hypothetical protein